MPEILCTPIGFVSSPFKERGDAPRQGKLTDEISLITLKEEYLPATLGHGLKVRAGYFYSKIQ